MFWRLIERFCVVLEMEGLPAAITNIAAKFGHTPMRGKMDRFA